MSTTVLEPRTALDLSSARALPHISFGRVVRSEWIKQRSLRSTWITLGLLLVCIVGFGLLAAWVTGHQPAGSSSGGPGDGASDPVAVVLAGAQFGVLLIAVLGVLVGAREYSSGMIRATLAAVPKRWPALIGKLIVFVGLTVPVVVGGVLVAFAGGTALLTSAGVASTTWGGTGVLPALLGTSGYLLGIGVLGVALGALFRGIAAGLGVLIGGVIFLPALLLTLLPSSWGAVLKYLPSNAGLAFTGTTQDPALLGQAAGVVVFVAWIVLAVVGALVALMRRDA